MALSDHQNLVGLVLSHPNVRPVGNASATGVIIVSWMGVLTPVLTAIATCMAIIWYAITIYESKTGQSFAIRLKAHTARLLKNTGHKEAGQKMADKALDAAVKVLEVAKVEVADAKDTVADVQTAVDKK